MTEPTLAEALRFLADLKQNNHKPWFDAHRADYEAARTAFEELVDDIIDEFRQSDQLEALRARNCTARIYRDMRFSKDKSPYKTNLAAMVAAGGWRTDGFGYYVSLEPGGQSMTAGGLYDPTPEQFERFRRAIARDSAEFKAICAAPEFRDLLGEVVGERLKTAPKGYERDHPEIDLLRLKQVYVQRSFSDAEVLAPGFAGEIIRTCHAMRPFLDYLKNLD
jgi:uncharacterized protein (TIGR02453 family)